MKHLITLTSLLVGAAQLTSANAQETAAPGQVYHVNGADTYIHCTGAIDASQPTVIILPGGGAPAAVYQELQKRLSEKIRTCAYDRAPLGLSRWNGKPANAANYAATLHELLDAADIDGPVILAAHSYGGFVALIYSAEHADRVAGIAFIDASHPNMLDAFGATFKQLFQDEIMSPQRLRLQEAIKAETPPDPRSAERAFLSFLSIENLENSIAQARAAFHSRGDLPIISISASKLELPQSLFDRVDITADEALAIRYDNHKELAELSEIGRHVIVKESEHISIVMSPDFVPETADHILSLLPDIEARRRGKE